MTRSSRVSGQGQASHSQTIWAGGMVRSVAIRKGLVAAADHNGTVKLYHLDDQLLPAGELRARGRIDHARFVGGYLWLRSHKRDWAEVWSLRDPAMPEFLGEVTGSGLALMDALFQGDRAFGFARDSLQVYRVQPTQ